MVKLKCAIMYSTDTDPLPNRQDIKRKIGAKILYGFGKHRTEKTSYSKRMHIVENAFLSIVQMFRASQPISFFSLEFMGFGEDVDEVFFALAFQQNTITTFSIDDSIIDDMHSLSWKIENLKQEKKSIELQKNKMIHFQDNVIGDNQFFYYFVKQIAHLDEYGHEVDRIINMYEPQLRSLFDNRW